MAIQIIKMPDIGEGIAEVELVAWHVKAGDTVTEDQTLADVMTDKATVEIPSPVTGTVLALGCTVGEVVAVGAEIIRIEIDTASGHGLPRPDGLAMTTSTSARTTPAQAGAASGNTSHAPAQAPTNAVIARSDSDAAIHAPESPAPPTPGGHTLTGNKTMAAPAVRRRAAELGIDLDKLSGSGPGGRITHADLDRTGSGTVGIGAGDPRYRRLDDEQAIPVIGLRRKIAQKMQDAKRRIPHFSYVEEVDVTELENLRARLNSQYGATRCRLTLLPFLIRAMVLAVRDHPEVNARYDDEAAVLTRYAAVHMGLATQTAGGLMVPVIRHAETLDLWACAAEVLRLAEAARSGKAAREELTGSTITLTSLGALGGIVSTPVINAPEVGIVGTNRIVERPMIVAGAVVARKMMNLSSSFDHRVVDGMNAAEFIQRVRGYLECPGTLLLD